MVTNNTKQCIKNKKKKKKKVSIKSLENKLKKILYPMIKKRDGNNCISCGKTGLIGMNWHAGHYAKAELCNLIWRYSPQNINSQCGGCNKWKHGNSVAYRNNLVKKIGEVQVRVIEESYNKPLPMNFDSRVYLETLITHFKQLCKK